jgi:hypothetical protein
MFVHGVLVSLPGALWRQRAGRQRAGTWPVPVWLSPQASSVSGATRSRSRECAHRWPCRWRHAVPASAFLLTCVVEMGGHMGEHSASFSTPFQWGLVLRMARSPTRFNLCWGCVAHFSRGSLNQVADPMIEAVMPISKTRNQLTLCSASNLAEARRLSSPLQGSSPAKTRASSRPSCAPGHHLRPSTNCYKLSEARKSPEIMARFGRCRSIDPCLRF